MISKEASQLSKENSLHETLWTASTSKVPNVSSSTSAKTKVLTFSTASHTVMWLGSHGSHDDRRIHWTRNTLYGRMDSENSVKSMKSVTRMRSMEPLLGRSPWLCLKQFQVSGILTHKTLEELKPVRRDSVRSHSTREGKHDPTIKQMTFRVVRLTLYDVDLQAIAVLTLLSHSTSTSVTQRISILIMTHMALRHALWAKQTLKKLLSSVFKLSKRMLLLLRFLQVVALRKLHRGSLQSMVLQRDPVGLRRLQYRDREVHLWRHCRGQEAARVSYRMQCRIEKASYRVCDSHKYRLIRVAL